MIVSDIVSRVTRLFGDDAQVQVNQADIIRWINDCQRDLALDNNLFKTTATLAATPNQFMYTFPMSYFALHSIKYNGITLKSLTQQEADEFIANNDASTSTLPVGVPTHYWVWGTTFHLYPAPSDAGTITLYYQRAPVDVVNPGDTPDVPLQYHNILVDYCVTQAYELDDNLYGYQVKKISLEDKIKEMKDNSEWELRQYYPLIASSSADATETDERYYY